MPSNLQPRRNSWPARNGSSFGLDRQQARTLAHHAGREVIHGQVVGARIEAKGYATLLACQLVGMASREAAFQSGGDTKALARMDLLVDQMTMSLASEIGRM